MTSPLPPEAHALVLLGELRGDVKGIARTLLDLNVRLAEIEANNGARFGRLEMRLSTLEAYRTKIAGFVIALALLMTLTKDKLPALATFILGSP